MTGPPARVADGEAGWEAFWQRTSESSALAGRGPQDEVLGRYWTAFFEEAFATGSRRRVADMACGNGAVAHKAMELARRRGPTPPEVFAADRSIAAIAALRRRLPEVHGVACDARRTPFPDHCFDIATSQFGIEYSGAAGFREVARIVAPGGLLAAVVHLRDGAMHRENTVNLEAARAIEQVAMLPALKALFHADALARQGRGSRAAVRAADATLAAAAARVAGVLAGFGAGVAGGMAQRLAGDVDHMRRRLRFHDAAEVMGWCDLMAQELAAYAGRMASMLDAALDADGLDAVVELLRAEGFSTRLRETTPLGRASGEPAAWLLVSERR